MFGDNVLSNKINYIPPHLKLNSDYNTDMTINSAFKQVMYTPDFMSGGSVRFIINSNGFLDPYSLNFYFTVVISDAEMWYQFDSSAHSIISKLTISCNGVELERIENYQYLNSILFDISLDSKDRENLEHHGFGCHTKDNLSYGTGEDCFPATEQIFDKNFDKQFKCNGQKKTLSVKHGIPDSVIHNEGLLTRSKTYILPLMSFLIGMNMNEYKYIPLHLFPYLQIDIEFNKFAMFQQNMGEKYFSSNFPLNALYPRNVNFEPGLLNLENQIGAQITNLASMFSKNDFFYLSGAELPTTIIIMNSICLNTVTPEKTAFGIRALLNMDPTDVGAERIAKLRELLFYCTNENLVEQMFSVRIVRNNVSRIVRAINGGVVDVSTINVENIIVQIQKLVEDLIILREQATHAIAFGSYTTKYQNTRVGRSFAIDNKCCIITEQLFFELSDHYRMINSINTFSVTSSGFESQKKQFNSFGKPNEVEIVNFAKRSIRKVFSTFHSDQYLTKANCRELSRYSANILSYSVRIGINNYPQTALHGDTSSSALENQNNTLFLSELFKAFEQSDYSNSNRGKKYN